MPGEGYSNRGYYTCPACGQRERVLEAVRRKEGPPEMEMFALEYYCPTCEREGYDRRATSQPLSQERRPGLAQPGRIDP